MALQSESTRTTEQILSQFHLKTLHAILSARIPQIHGAGPNPSRHRKRDRWFHLCLADLPPALDHLGGFFPMEPLFVDIVLSPRNAPGNPEPIVERWTATCEHPAPADNFSGGFLVKKSYSKLMILLRSLYSILRLLPAYRIFRMLCRSNQAYNYDMSYRVSSFAEPFTREEEAGFRLYSFCPVETVFGQLAVSVQYRPSLAEFKLEVSSLLPPMLITDYVGSPTTDPLRAFPASLPMGGSARPPLRTVSAPVFEQRPHSWTGIPMSHHPLGPTPTPSQQMVYRLSPTPSPPTFGVNYLHSRLRSETAPLSIPQAASGTSQLHLTPNHSDPTRNFLPPPSPRRADVSSQESASFRKSEGFKVADLLSNLYAQKGLKDGRDDSGRFSGVLSSGGSPRIGFSRSSSRLSMQDDLDDADLSCPFAVDDVDSDSQTRSNDGKEIHAESGQAWTPSHKSQDSAVGVLVHMLRTAPALRDHSYSSQSTKSEFDGEAGSSFMSRKTSDALEELQTYKQIKEILLSKSRAQLQDSPRQ